MENERILPKRLHATVYGHVQGVNFRAFTRRKADELRLTGWVRNMPGGAVEALAEGPQDALEELLGALHEGSPSASVSRVEAIWDEATNEFTDFRVRYF
jgi:acylphosphatase